MTSLASPRHAGSLARHIRGDILGLVATVVHGEYEWDADKTAQNADKHEARLYEQD